MDGSLKYCGRERASGGDAAAEPFETAAKASVYCGSAINGRGGGSDGSGVCFSNGGVALVDAGATADKNENDVDNRQ